MKSFREQIDGFPLDKAKGFNPAATLRSEDSLSGLVGAWGLAFGLRSQEQPEQVEMLRDVIGREDRRPVADTTQFPWSRICCLLLTYASGAQALGTGWLAGPRTVLTAGHCVFQHGFGWAKSVLVVPGWNGGAPESSPLGVHTSTRCRSVRAWVERGEEEYDCGAVILPETSVLPGPFIPFAAASDSALQGREIMISGYPIDRDRGTMWTDAQPLQDVNSSFLFYDVDTEDGESGAPVLAQDNQGSVAVGLHTDGRSGGNFGIRITEELVEIFRGWVQVA